MSRGVLLGSIINKVFGRRMRRRTGEDKYDINLYYERRMLRLF